MGASVGEDTRSPARPGGLREYTAPAMTTDLPPEHASSWFDPIYRAADGDPSGIPWAALEPSPWLVDHLGAHPGPGRAVVVGCGLGDDAEAVAAAGYETVAFDVSLHAVEWCRDRFRGSAVDYRLADLLDLPAVLVGSADLVVENRTIQSLPPSVRTAAIDAVASLLAPAGYLLLITWLRPDDAVPTGPPWAVSAGELERFEEEAGLEIEWSRADVRNAVRLYRRP